MMNNACHLRMPLFLWNFVVSPSGSGVTLWSAMIETQQTRFIEPRGSGGTDRFRSYRQNPKRTDSVYTLYSSVIQTSDAPCWNTGS